MKVKDLSSVELKALIQEAVEKALLDLLGDPDQGLKLREGIQERLKHSLKRVQKGERGIPAEEAAWDAGVKRVVYASSSSIYGDSPELPKHEEMTPAPRSPYAVSKLAGELYCQVFHQVYGLETVILRYFNVFGPRQDPNSQYSGVVAKFITSLLEGKQVTIFGDGEQSRDFTYVENVTEANLLAAKADGVSGGVFNIACGDRLSINELARLLAEIVGADRSSALSRSAKSYQRHAKQAL